MDRLLARLRAWYVRRWVADLRKRAAEYHAEGEYDVYAELTRMANEMEKRDGR
jgi:hypothetical protein